ncbi:MAG TPA: PDZ domain-containing protein [Candidatus Acidoferrum sp.]|nr:PDZ domain-containing protein [Candidatus Acidoferrum sp.]
MNTRNLLTVGGVAALSLGLIALASVPARSQCPDNSAIAKLEQKLEKLQARLAERQNEINAAAEAGVRAQLASQIALAKHQQAIGQLENLPALADDDDNISIFADGEGASWLGVELHEVTSENVKEFKLPAERGVVLGKIVSDSPAAKAGLKENDVVTELNGQRIEGAAQLRRMIHEIPAGRTVQLNVWRDGKSQSVSVTLGKSAEGQHSFKMIMPEHGNFSFSMPEIPMIPPMEWNGSLLIGGQPRLGIDAEDLNGQLGNFFGAPEGEGILVREVNPDSPAEKAGVKAGDVITSFDGQRIRTLSELREKLAAKRDEKDRNVKLGVLRNRSEVSLTVELPAPTPRAKHVVSHRTNI